MFNIQTEFSDQWERFFTEHFFILHPQRSSKHVFHFLPVTMSRKILRLLSLSIMKVLQWICCDVTLLYQTGLCPLVNWGMINSHSVSEYTAQVKAINLNTQWKHLALMKRGVLLCKSSKVNMTYFLSCEKSFLSHSSNRLRHFHCITSGLSVFKDLCRFDEMTTASLLRFWISSFFFKKGKNK